MNQIRYEIESTKPGIILDASLVKQIITSRHTKKAMVLAIVDKKDKTAFEKSVEGNTDPRYPEGQSKDWRRQ